MFLHIGADFMLDLSDIICICDIESTTMSVRTRNFLKKAEKDGRLVAIDNEIPKSFILVNNGEIDIVYLSSISSLSLKKRSQNIFITDV